MTKFKKEQNKKLKIKDGFFDPLTWISTGNFALNKMMTGDYNRGVPVGSATAFAGESGSGKSYIASGNIIKNALEEGVGVVLLDTEGAIKKTWATALGVDTDNDAIVRWNKRTINQVTATIADFVDGYSDDWAKMAREEQPPVLIIIDSLGNLETDAGVKQFNEGELRGDQGLFAKQLKSMMKNIIGSFDGFQLGVVGTMHTYINQNQYSDHEDIIAGGRGPIYLCDIVVNMNKTKLRDVEEVLDEKTGKMKKKKAKEVQGIVSKIKCVKSRYAKPFSEVEVQIPYDRGMDPYSGLFELFEKKVFRKDGQGFVYMSKEQNKEIKLKRSQMDNMFFDQVMREWDDSSIPTGVNELEDEDDDNVE